MFCKECTLNKSECLRIRRIGAIAPALMIWSRILIPVIPKIQILSNASAAEWATDVCGDESNAIRGAWMPASINASEWSLVISTEMLFSKWMHFKSHSGLFRK